MVLFSPSLLACDFSRIGEQLKLVESCGADYIHLDVMDGVFVNNISFGIPVIKSIRKCTSLTFDVHLMIIDPIKCVKAFAESGADIITFHMEANSDILKTIEEIRKCGCSPALSISPGSAAQAVFPYLPLIDMVLVMSVEPGFGGQSFIPESLDKIRAIREECERLNIEMNIEVDGGINVDNVNNVIAAGGNVIVVGSAVFGAENPAEVIAKLKGG